MFAARKMSRNSVEDGYFSSTENNENRNAVKLRVKDGEARETRVPVQGKRTVLGTLTNRPFTNVAVKAKQVHTTLHSFFRFVSDRPCVVVPRMSYTSNLFVTTCTREGRNTGTTFGRMQLLCRNILQLKSPHRATGITESSTDPPAVPPANLVGDAFGKRWPVARCGGGSVTAGTTGCRWVGSCIIIIIIFFRSM